VTNLEYLKTVNTLRLPGISIVTVVTRKQYCVLANMAMDICVLRNII